MRRAKVGVELFLIFFFGVLLMRLIHCGSTTSSFVLERIGSTSSSSIDIVARDRIRHAHIFRSYGVVNYPLQGSFDTFLYGFYFTRVRLGSPPREYNLLIDTGSDTTWVKCKPCNGCPLTGATIETSYFDPHSSYSAETVSCSGHICKSVVKAHGCSSDSVCTYSIPYADASSSSGYYVADSFHFDTIHGNSSSSSSATANYSATIVFGCTTNLAGRLTNPQVAVDGIFGLGNQPISVISQLALGTFSHCLKGDGGGILVFGEVVEPGIVYTPLVPSRPHYSLNLLSISISGQTVPIHREVFATSKNGGTIVDSGTTYAYLAADAYDPFVTALVAAVPPSVDSYSYKGNPCFHVSSSLRNFPLVTLNFVGGASMALRPEEYLIRKLAAGPQVWCVGFIKSEGLTILGELVLKDKIIVYDLVRQRLGWVEYDCLSSVNVSSVPPRVNNSSQATVLYSFFTGSLCMILMLLFSC